MHPVDLEALLSAARGAARDAGVLIRARLPGLRQVSTKSSAIDLVTDTDHAADRLIVERLLASFPDHAVLSEEAGLVASNSAPEVTWIVDPLDGTTNFAHRLPQFAVSIAAIAGGPPRDAPAAGGPPDQRADTRTLVGVVYDPMRDEMFCATEATRTTLDGIPVSVSDAARLAESLISTGFPYDRRERVDFYLRFWREMMLRSQDLRRVGAAALDLAWVACGRIDGFWEWHLKPWDVAAGNLLVRGAGGRVTDFAGVDPGVDARQTLASNGIIHDQMLSTIAGVLSRAGSDRDRALERSE